MRECVSVMLLVAVRWLRVFVPDMGRHEALVGGIDCLRTFGAETGPFKSRVFEWVFMLHAIIVVAKWETQEGPLSRRD